MFQEILLGITSAIIGATIRTLVYKKPTVYYEEIAITEYHDLWEDLWDS